jgi:hypothetical protein
MRTTARSTRDNRTITVDFQRKATYVQLLSDGKAFVECVLAFLLALGFQLKHKAPVAVAGSSPTTPMMSVFAWEESSSGVSSAPRVVRCAPSCPTSSCRIARCRQRWPATPYWQRMGG